VSLETCKESFLSFSDFFSLCAVALEIPQEATGFVRTIRVRRYSERRLGMALHTLRYRLRARVRNLVSSYIQNFTTSCDTHRISKGRRKRRKVQVVERRKHAESASRTDKGATGPVSPPSVADVVCRNEPKFADRISTCPLCKRPRLNSTVPLSLPMRLCGKRH
jgi:hypothetical protein